MIEEAQEILRTLVELSKHEYVPPYAVALIHAGLDDADEAFDWLDRASRCADVHFVFLLIDPKWDEYRRHHRLVALLRTAVSSPANPTVRRRWQVTGRPTAHRASLLCRARERRLLALGFRCILDSPLSRDRRV